MVLTTEPGWVSIDLQRMSDWFMTTDRPKNLTLVVHAYYENKNITHVRTPYVTDARNIEDITEVRYNKFIITLTSHTLYYYHINFLDTSSTSLTIHHVKL